MDKTSDMLLDVLFENGGICNKRFFIQFISKKKYIKKSIILNSINNLINEQKLYLLEDKYLSLTDFGDLQEIKIDKLLNRLVYGKFLFKNPKLLDGDEFCDNLIFFNGTLIIFQSKTKNYTKINEFDKFRKKCIDNSIKQLNRAINRAMNDQIKKRFKNNINEEIEINSKSIKNIIGVCVSYFHPSKNYFITKGNEQFLKNKNLIPNIVTYQELQKIIELNDTLPEFIEYLDKRRILVQKNVPLLSENKILGYFFLTNRTMIPVGMTSKEFDNLSVLIIDDDYEYNFEKGVLKKKLEERDTNNKNSYFIDMIINKVLPNVPVENETFFIELLNINRFQRRVIANNILPIYNDFFEHKSDFRAPFISLDKETGYLFIFSRKEQDFKINQEILTNHAIMMKTKHKLKKIIGISENHYKDGTANHNFCIVEGDINLDKSKLPQQILDNLNDKSKLKKLKGFYEFD